MMKCERHGLGKLNASVSAAAAEMPAFMKEHAGRGMECTGPKDLPWLGDDGNLDFEDLLAKRGFDPLLPLDYILLAIIDASPIEGVNRRVRLEKALAALTGKTGRRQRGMDEKDDYELLLRMGWEYHCLFWDGDRAPQDIKGIARKVASKQFPHLPSGDLRLDSIIDRLRRKFTKNKDLYISRAAEQYNFQRMDMHRAVRRVLKRLQYLGVPVDLSSPRPVLLSIGERRLGPLVFKDKKPV